MYFTLESDREAEKEHNGGNESYRYPQGKQRTDRLWQAILTFICRYELYFS